MDTQPGHPLLTPDYREIRLPSYVFRRLEQLGVLPEKKYRIGSLRMRLLTTGVWLFLDDEFDVITAGLTPSISRHPLRHILGYDLTGPLMLCCFCRECCKREEDWDKTRVSHRGWAAGPVGCTLPTRSWESVFG